MNQEIQSLYKWKKWGKSNEGQGWSGLSGRCRVDVNTKN